MKIAALGILAICAIIHRASGHGRLMEPPSRSSAWRFGYSTPHNYDDNALFCGGFSTQQSNGGKCGVCGDPWNGRRDNEAGGKYATGTIVRKYKMGQTITIKVDITANHKGWFEYSICPNNDVKKPVTHECLKKNVLRRADGKGTKQKVDSARVGIWSMDFKLPDRMTCSQCVIQWKYHTGNSWGVDKATRQGCVGCGPQEEFYGCADVSIEGNDALPVQPVVKQTTPAPTLPPITERKTTKAPVVITQAPPRTQAPPFTQAPPKIQAPVAFIPIDARIMQATLGNLITTPRDFIGVKLPCKGIHNWANDPSMDQWCTDNCAVGNCPSYGCDCSGSLAGMTEKTTQRPTTTTRSTTTSTTTTTVPTTTTTTTTTPEPTTTTTTTRPTTTKATTMAKPVEPVTEIVSHVVCKAINLWAGNEYLDNWCADSCARGNCPPDSCRCSTVEKVVTHSTTTTLLPEVVRSTIQTQAPPPQAKKDCHAISLWKGITVFDVWCTDECNKGNCPVDTCACTDAAVQPMKTEQPTTTTTVPTTTTTTKKPDVTSFGRCSSNGVVAGDYWNGWCQSNCDRGSCQIDYCACNL